MKWTSAAFSLCACSLLAAAGGPAAADPAKPAQIKCEELARLNAPDIAIVSAQPVAAGPFVAEPGQVAEPLPAFCRVKGVATPSADSHIEFEVWIPTETWNGKFQAVGVGGYAGSISYGAMMEALKRGYAVEGNDTGHKGGDLDFGLGHPEKVVDWAWRAMHVSAQAGKLIVRNGAGRWPTHSYFVGCSSGGHQALSEVQRFPADFDGVIAGDPGYNRVHQTAAYLYSWLALHDAAGAPLLSGDDLKLVTKAATAACGDADGVIEEPRICKFDPAALLCKGGKTGACLTQGQIDAVRKVYAGAHNPRTGERIYAGWTVGSEAGWTQFLSAPKTPMRNEVYGWFVFGDPHWDFRSFDFDRDLAFADRTIGHMAAVDPDLSSFRANGGKLLMYTGWMDPIAPPEDAAAYYEAVAGKMGGASSASAFYRFFMVPGMQHCQGGPGATEFDMLDTLERWVERGEAPERVLAAHRENGAVVRTRPLCPYPKVARYVGKGDRKDAANFACVAPTPRKAR